MSLSSKLKKADDDFLSQVVDPALRKQEIARLKRGRRMAVLGVFFMSLMAIVLLCFYYLIAVTSRIPISDRDYSRFVFVMGSTAFFWLCQMLALQGTQNKLRLLLFEERLCALQNRSTVGTP